MPLGSAATHNDGMGCARPCFFCFALLSYAVLAAKEKMGKKKTAAGVWEDFQKVMLVPLQEIDEIPLVR